MQAMTRGFSLFAEALVVLETWDLNTEQYRKVATAIQNAIQGCRDITGLFFKRVDRIESSQKLEPVLSTSVNQFSQSVMSDSLQLHGLQHTRFPCPSPTPGACSNPCPSSWWCHPTISSSGVPFSSHLQPFPASGSFPMSQFFTSGGQSIGVLASASVLPMNIQDWSPLGWTGWISLQSKGLLRVLSNTAVQKHQFFTSGASEVAACPPSLLWWFFSSTTSYPLSLLQSKNSSCLFSWCQPLYASCCTALEQ